MYAEQYYTKNRSSKPVKKAEKQVLVFKIELLQKAIKLFIGPTLAKITHY